MHPISYKTIIEGYISDQKLSFHIGSKSARENVWFEVLIVNIPWMNKYDSKTEYKKTRLIQLIKYAKYNNLFKISPGWSVF